MKHYMFLDESGDHNITAMDPQFPVFVLCGILISADNYSAFKKALFDLKQKYFNTDKVILHSRDIRRCDKAFMILLDLQIKRSFYEDLNSLIKKTPFTIVASCIDKLGFLKKYGKILADDVYEISTSFLLERTVFYLDAFAPTNEVVYTAIEKRGKKEDGKLVGHINEIIYSKGTYYVDQDRFRAKNFEIYLKDKRENIAGLQLADLVAYPIARRCIDGRDIPNASYDLIKPKFYMQYGRNYGEKHFP